MSDTSSSGKTIAALFERLASSAELSIAAALLLVCVAVGGALWWLQPEDTVPPVSLSAAPVPAQALTVDEQAAFRDRQRQLAQQFSAIDAQQERRMAQAEAEAEARLAQQQAAEAALLLKKQVEQREAELIAAEARRADVAQPPAVNDESRIVPTTAPPTPAATAAQAPATVDATIDWASCTRPTYPTRSVSRGEEGVVVIAVELDAEAVMQNIEVRESSGHSRLDRVTLDAVGKCRFTPATEAGIAKASVAEVRFVWTLQN